MNYDTEITQWNSYEGGPFQQAVSALAYVPTNKAYNGNFEQYGLEYWGDPKDDTAGYITWHVGGVPTWKMLPAMVAANPATQISQRQSECSPQLFHLGAQETKTLTAQPFVALLPVPVEPMSIILNFGMSDGFQKVDFANLKWPAEMVRPFAVTFSTPTLH